MKIREAINKVLNRLFGEEKTLTQIEFEEDYLYPEYLRGAEKENV